MFILVEQPDQELLIRAAAAAAELEQGVQPEATVVPESSSSLILHKYSKSL